MGTHPIFESDFDCLTEMEERYKKTLILGDSMIKFIKPETFEPNPVYLYSYPGIRAFDLNRCLKEAILPPPREIGLVIVHVGTNDASQTRVQSGTDKVAEAIIAIFATLDTLYPNAEK